MDNVNRSPRHSTAARLTASEIKLAYAINRQRRRKPRSQYEHAAMLRVPRSMVCVAIKNPTRYPGLRRRIERRLASVVVARAEAS